MARENKSEEHAEGSGSADRWCEEGMLRGELDQKEFNVTYSKSLTLASMLAFVILKGVQWMISDYWMQAVIYCPMIFSMDNDAKTSTRKNQL